MTTESTMPHHRPADHARFTVAVVADTQYYANHRYQTELGFPFNAREILWDMMHHIARNSVQNGGEIVFATGLGDMWLHPMSADMDAAHVASGAKSVRNPILEKMIPPAPDAVLGFEIPTVKAAYDIIASCLPFSVIPGNHDHDHWWTDASVPVDAERFGQGDMAGVGQLHCGSLLNWTAHFGAESVYFKDQPWYVSSFRGGINSAQLFEGGGYRFLHIGLEMSPDEPAILWAESVLRALPDLPVIVSIHEFLNGEGERKPIACFDLSRLDPHRYNPERLWERFISRHDQILMVLNGHFHGVRHRVDQNQHGHPVFQFLSNYQGRKQMLIDNAPGTAIADGIGDGWLRLMQFDLDAARPRVQLRAYSTYYKAFSTDLPAYGAWYQREHPELSAADIVALDNVELALPDFHQRFPRARIHPTAAAGPAPT